MLAILDYKAGNQTSVLRALRSLGVPAEVTADPEVIMNAEGVIFPGVGAAGQAMSQLTSTGMDSILHRCVEAGKPLLGICLGCQILLERSEENDRFVERLLARFAERRAASLVNPPAPEEDEEEEEEEDNDVQAETKEETNVAPEATASAADAAVSTEEQAPPTENDAETAAVEASPKDAADAPTLEEDAQETTPTEDVQDQTKPETEEGEPSNGTEN